ncbi:9861_t:CDS:2 [Cetraspora pellucida]|uniref:9861_t:CDS:1 n=1 Tax=Cetraspora pellucida TaxID=1433469 RepID=A0ACA9LH25_9GLOM|nr:9861_t:CDS:2 [Cetraspora pellucida]
MKKLLIIGFLVLLQKKFKFKAYMPILLNDPYLSKLLVYSIICVDLYDTFMAFVPKNSGVWSACTTPTITYLDFSLVYSLSGTPTVPSVGHYYYGNISSTADHHGFKYALFPYTLNGTTDYCGSNTTVCRLATFHNYTLPRDYYCVAVVNPNNVDYYLTMVYSFGGTNARRSIILPKKGVYERQSPEFKVASPEILDKFRNLQG